MKQHAFIISASLATTIIGAKILSASPSPAAQYTVSCWYTEPRGAGVTYNGGPCDGQAAVLACQEASTLCGMQLEVSVSSGCGTTCREVS